MTKTIFFTYNTALRRFLSLTGLVLFGIMCFWGFFANTAEAAVIRRAPNNLGLVAYYSFDDARGSTATDFSGNGNVGTLTNMNSGSDWVAGKRGTALYFEGAEQHVDFGNSDELQMSNGSGTDFPMTIAGWVKVPSNSDRVNLLTKTGPNTTDWEYYLAVIDGELRFRFYDYTYDGGSNDRITYASNNFDRYQEWVHVAVTYDGSKSTSGVDLYLNGETMSPTNTNDTNYSGGRSGDHNLRTGVFGLGGEYESWTDGQVDEVRVYDRALKSSEIKDLYSAGGYAKRNATNDALYSDKLVSHLTMDGPDVNGSTVKDVFGANDGTKISNPVARPGRTGQSLNFDGVDDAVNMGAQIEPKAENITYAAWVNLRGVDDTSNSHRVVASLSDSSNDTPANSFFTIGDWAPSGNTTLEFGFNDGSFTEVNSDSEISITRWQHIAASFDGSEVKFYLNGELLSSKAFSHSLPADSGQEFGIGARRLSNFDSRVAFDGLIDDVRFYDQVLSTDEISRLYTATKPDTINSSQNEKLTDGLKGFWSFDGQDLTSATATDVSTNNNDGTLKSDPQPAIGRIGQALKFDGGDNHVDIDIAQMPQGTGSYSASAWFKTSKTQNSGAIIMWGTGDKNNSTGIGLDYDGENEQALFILWDSDLKVSQSYSDGEWHHMVGVHDNASGKIKIFFDGNQIGSATENPDIGSNFAAIGTNDYIPNGPVNTMDGKIDNVRIYDRALSESEIERLYSLGR